MSPVIIRQATIKRPVDEVWDALVNARSIAAWQGGGKVRSDARVGGRYAIFDGATTSRYLTVQRLQRLAYTWRQDDWDAASPDSVVSWRLEAINQATVVRLRHRGLPNQAEFAGHAQGWREYFLAPMKAWLESRPRRAKRNGGPPRGRRATK